MKVFLCVFVVFLACSWGVGATAVPHNACPGTRDDLLLCFHQLIDTNNDGNITLTELNAMFSNYANILPNSTEFLEHYTASNIITMCDIDQDGVLSPADWNHANACLRNYMPRDYVCRYCHMADGMVKKK